MSFFCLPEAPPVSAPPPFQLAAKPFQTMKCLGCWNVQHVQEPMVEFDEVLQ